MEIQSIIQNVAPIANAVSAIVLAVGYYFLIELYREWVRQYKERYIAGGRPMVVGQRELRPSAPGQHQGAQL